MEMEQKYRIDDPKRIEAMLIEHGATFHHAEYHRDLYLNAPDRDFYATDEVLRLRTIDDKSTLTYKGPKQSREIKVRQEIEVDLVPARDVEARMIDLLRALKYRPIAEVRKERHLWKLQLAGPEMTICIDHLEGEGDFLEIEIIAPDEQYDRVRMTIMRTEQLLELHRREDRSYLAMILERHGNIR